MVFYINDNVAMFHDNTTVFNTHWDLRFHNLQSMEEDQNENTVYPFIFNSDAKTAFTSATNYHEFSEPMLSSEGSANLTNSEGEADWRQLSQSQLDEYSQRQLEHADSYTSFTYPEMMSTPSERLSWTQYGKAESCDSPISFPLFGQNNVEQKPLFPDAYDISPTLEQLAFQLNWKRHSHQPAHSTHEGLITKRLKLNPAMTANIFHNQTAEYPAIRVRPLASRNLSFGVMDHAFMTNPGSQESTQTRLSNLYEKRGKAERLDKPISCGCCGKEFHDFMELAKHIDKEGLVRENFCPDEKCTYSIIGFKRRVALRRHICNHHLKRYNLKARSGKQNSQTDLLDVSQNSESESDLNKFLSKVYVCKEPDCSRAFYRLDSLLRHHRCIHQYDGVEDIKSEDGDY